MSPLEISATPKRAPARCVAPSVTSSPRSNMLGLTINPCAKLTSPMTPPEQALSLSPTLHAGLTVTPSAMLSVRLVALPIRPPAAFLPATLSAETSMPVGRATVAPSRASPIRPPALAPSAVALIVGVPSSLSGRARPASVSDAPSARVFTSKPMLPALDCISTARGLFALVV